MVEVEHPLSAASVTQLVAWCSAVPTLVLNVLLAMSIRRERTTDNRFRWFNSMFLYSVYSTTLLLATFLLLQPAFLTARGLTYIAFFGPLSRILPRFALRILFAFLVGTLSYQVFVAPISLVFRWFVVTKRISCTCLRRSLVGLFFFGFCAPFPILVETILNLPEEMRIQPEDVSQDDMQRDIVKKLCGSNTVMFLILGRRGSLLLLLTITVPFTLAFFTSLLFHRIYMKMIRTMSNDCIELGYHDSAAVSKTFFAMASQNFLLVTVPFAILAASVVVKWELGVRALPITLGCLYLPLVTASTLFIKFRAYRRQTGFLAVEFLRLSNGTIIPIGDALHHQNHQSTVQMSAEIRGPAP